MPITINGSGTITGISAGGLPDGSVTNDDLATGISSSKLSGALPAIDGSNLTGIVTGLTASAFSQNANGYITLSNGLIIQWGRVGALANGGNRTVSFPITFPNNCWSLAASWTVMTSGTHHSAFPDTSISTSSFGAHNVSGATNGVVFVAVGN
tara:strand:- start:272 stop:730 length:459 start_codon:yes stop_codon:yes gene_type:complete